MRQLTSPFFTLVLVSFVVGGCGGMAPPDATTARPTATPTLSPGTTRTDSKGIEQAWVPAGSFLMGTSDDEADAVRDLDPPFWVKGELRSEQPQHEVRLTSGFWIDKYEVTNSAFQAFVDDGGYLKQDYWSEDGRKWLEGKSSSSIPVSCANEEEEPDHPRVCVTWYEAEAYARWRGGQLPTEAQWEYAARGPQSLIYPWGNTIDSSKANVVDSSGLTRGRCQLGRRSRHGGQRDGMGPGLAGHRVLQVGHSRRSSRPRNRQAQDRKGRLVGKQPVRRTRRLPPL